MLDACLSSLGSMSADSIQITEVPAKKGKAEGWGSQETAHLNISFEGCPGGLGVVFNIIMKQQFCLMGPCL